MTDAQRNRWDVKLVYRLVTLVYIVLFGWNLIPLYLIAYGLNNVLKFVFDSLHNIRRAIIEYFISYRNIMRDGKIGSDSKFWKDINT